MKWNRSWPGVPNRYSHRSPGSAIRPKSIAPVVEVLRSDTPPASSTPTECSVSAASVRSGSMSEIEPMKVVLPTAKPPATTILTVVGATAVAGAGVARSERGNAIENTLQNAERGSGVVIGGDRAVDAGVTLFDEVADQDPDNAHRQMHVR